MPGWMHEDPHGVRHTKRHLGRLAWLDCEKGKHSLHKTRHAPKPHCMHWCEQISSIKRVGRLAHGHRCISASRTQNSTKEVHFNERTKCNPKSQTQVSTTCFGCVHVEATWTGKCRVMLSCMHVCLQVPQTNKKMPLLSTQSNTHGFEPYCHCMAFLGHWVLQFCGKGKGIMTSVLGPLEKVNKNGWKRMQ